MVPRLIIFDFDGVVADSETLACTVAARLVSKLGHPMSVDEAVARFIGKRIGEVAKAIEDLVGRSLPGLEEDLQSQTIAAFEKDLHEVPGASSFLETHQSIKRCIASSSSLRRVQACLDILNISSYFENAIFSADMVKNGKPFPDIFLYAAEMMQVHPKDVVVIEDSASGVEAAVAAGMCVVGLLAASHLRPGHERMLREKGVSFIAYSYSDVSAFLSRH